ncbi:MAG: DUF4435 domain-containing protein [Muribaculaceae bacterium]|nr:DUF4435 domain-containing protein [Muribaculaceae bacterium]
MSHTRIASPVIALPPRTDGKQPLTISPEGGHIVIVGANGAGKTRFASNMASEPEARAFIIAALPAIFDRAYTDLTPGSLDCQYDQAVTDGMIRAEGSTQFERLLALLMHHEMLNLMAYKLAHASDTSAVLRPTRLDTLISLWQEIFPDNHILIQSGRMLFSRGSAEDSYSSVRLSAGEKAIIYIIGAALFAPRGSAIFVDSPDMLLHPSITQSVWNRIELLRPDCMFVYTTHDLDFASSRQNARVIWVRSFNAEASTWDYEMLPTDSAISDDMYLTILGARKPVLFIEGDGRHSIDAKLYPLVFKEYTVKSLGSCNKVIEATRTFNDLTSFHHMDSRGIVDRDRRDEKEVEYLRGKGIMVPDVAEIENILMLEEVIRTVACSRGKNESKVFRRVKQAVMSQFSHDLHQQALLHTRHRVKRTMEYRIDGRFANIAMLEEHMSRLLIEIDPRGLYEDFCREFHRYLELDDYPGVLKVYNQKSMLPGSNVAGLCGLKNKDEYIRAIIDILRCDNSDAHRIRAAITKCFGLEK